MNYSNNILKIVCTLVLLFSCKENKRSYSDQILLQDKYHPLIHFSPENNWIGAPCGFVYADGEYHFFYEQNLNTSEWGNLNWGHAVSRDLVHWETLPIAISSDSLGNIFSGSVVYDTKNTSNLGTLDNPPYIAFYTQLDQDKFDQNQKITGIQSLAYSLDKGRTWTKYKRNPIIKKSNNLLSPKVFWYEQNSKWIMCLGAKDSLNLYASADCIHWEYLSSYKTSSLASGTFLQYPELFPLKVFSSDETKWVLLVKEAWGPIWGSPATKYIVGDFDGYKFKATQFETGKYSFLLDYGRDIYANISCSNEPNNRRIIIGSMNSWQYTELDSTIDLKGSVIFPRELNLIKEDLLYLLTSKPIVEINTLFGRSKSICKYVVSANSKIIFDKLRFNKVPTKIELVFDISEKDWIGFPISYGITFKNSFDEYYTIKYENYDNEFFIQRKVLTNNEFTDYFNLYYYLIYSAKGPTFEWDIILDNSSIEFFADGDKVSFTNAIFPSESFNTIELFTEGGPLHVLTCTITELKSINNEKTSKTKESHNINY